MKIVCRTTAAVMLAGLLLLPAEAFSLDLFTKENPDVKEGNALLDQEKPDKAVAAYNRAAKTLPKRHAVNLNRGLALSRLGDEQFDEAVYAFKMAAEGHGPAPVRARALANLGNAFFKKEDYQSALDYYKQSLMLVPGNKDVAWNYELARQRQKKKEEEQKKNQDKQKDQNQQKPPQDQDKGEKDKKDDQKKEDKKDQPEKKRDKKPEEKKDKPEEPKKEEKKPEEPKSKQEIEQLLDSLDNLEDNLQKKMAERRAAAMPARRLKDW